MTSGTIDSAASLDLTDLAAALAVQLDRVTRERQLARPRKSRKRRNPKTLTRAEVRALFGACVLRYPTGLRDRCMLELMYRAGLRVGEVCALEPANVDTERGEIRVVDGKSGDGTAYFDPAPAFDGRTVGDLIERWKTVRTDLGLDESRTLFCTIKSSLTRKGGVHVPGRAVSVRSMQKMIKRRAAKAGLDPTRVGCHRLRHTYATELLEDGFSIVDVSALMRHRDLKTTTIYLHVSNPQLRARVLGRERGADDA
jgi:integrase/recombinase XerD